MKILFVTTVSSTVNAFLIPHIRQLIKAGHQVDIACATNQLLDMELAELGCHKWDIEFSRSPFNFQQVRAYFQIKQIITEEKYDLVHTHTPTASLITRLACRNLPVKVIYTAHGFHFYKGAPILNWLVFYPLERLAAHWTDWIITMNQEDLSNASQFKLRQKVLFTHGVGLQREIGCESLRMRQDLRDFLDIADDETVLLNIAELSKRKNQLRLIQNFAELKSQGFKGKLVLVGDGAEQINLENTAEELGVLKDVVFTGYQRDVIPYLSIADIMVTASRQEGLPVNVLEAFSASLPVVATKIRGHVDLIESEINGFLYETNQEFIDSIQAIVQKNKQIYQDNIQKKLDPYRLNNVQNELDAIYRMAVATVKSN